MIDQTCNSVFHLEAFQTLKNSDQSLLDFYADNIIKRLGSLKKFSNYLVVDAYFAKHTFIDALYKIGMHVTSRLGTVANLKYLYDGPKRKGRGKPKKYDGKLIMLI